MIYSLEQKQGDEWVNVAYAEFTSYEDADEEAKILAEVYHIPWEEMRIRSVKEIPVEELTLCECGFPVTFLLEGRRVHCDRCEREFDREDL